MTIDALISVLVTVTLIEMMALIGLSVTFAELAGVFRDWRIVTRAAVANYVCVPAATVGLLLLFNAHPMISAGFLVLAVCPGAPYAPPLAALAKGNVAVTVGLMVLLAGSSAVIAPLLLRLLLPIVSGDASLTIDTPKIVTTLLLTQLLPLCFGVGLRQWRPSLAQRLRKPGEILSKLLNLAVIGMILVVQFRLILEIQLRGWLGMLILLAVSLFAGWLLGGRDAGVRKAMTLTTALRNVGVGLVIATASFPRTSAQTAVLVYGMLGIVGSLLTALWWSRQPIPDDTDKRGSNLQGVPPTARIFL